MLATVQALAPGFLIATPQLQDPNFEKAVVLMIQHSDEGSMGLIINKPSPLSFRELGESQGLTVAPTRAEDVIFLGGPVEQQRGFLLHDAASVEEKLELLPGLFLSVTPEALEPLLTDATASLRFLLGYAGWGAGQLERELAEGAWLFCEASRGPVLDVAPHDAWAAVLERMGIAPGWIVPSRGLQ